MGLMNVEVSEGGLTLFCGEGCMLSSFIFAEGPLNSLGLWDLIQAPIVFWFMSIKFPPSRIF